MRCFLIVAIPALLTGACREAAPPAAPRPPAPTAPAPAPVDTSALDAYFRASFPADEPGIAVLIAERGRTVFAAGYGLADLELAAKVQLRHLLTHTSGLPDNRPVEAEREHYLIARTVKTFPGWTSDEPPMLGWSWFVEDVEGPRQIGHSGSQGGFLTNYFIVPDKDVLVVVLMNAPGDYTGVMTELRRWLDEQRWLEGPP